MKLPPFSPNTQVVDQRDPVFQKKMDFLMRYLRAVDHRNMQDGTEWREDQDNAYNMLYPPSMYKEPPKNFQLPPDIGKFRNHHWDDYLMGRKNGTQ